MWFSKKLLALPKITYYLCPAFRIAGNAEVRPANVKGNARQMRSHGENLGCASHLS